MVDAVCGVWFDELDCDAAVQKSAQAARAKKKEFSSFGVSTREGARKGAVSRGTIACWQHVSSANCVGVHAWHVVLTLSFDPVRVCAASLMRGGETAFLGEHSPVSPLPFPSPRCVAQQCAVPCPSSRLAVCVCAYSCNRARGPTSPP